MKLRTYLVVFLLIGGVCAGYSRAASVLVIDDASNGTSAVIASHLSNLGYLVVQETATSTDPVSWGNYDFIVWSCGDNIDTVHQEAWRTNLEDYVGNDGVLWIEGGELGANYGGVNPTFSAEVLFISDYHFLEPAGDILFAEGIHPIVTLPNYLHSPITHTYSYWGDQDSVFVAPNAALVTSWTLETQGGASIVAYDPDEDIWNGGQVVFTAFNFSALDADAQEPLAENIADYLTGGAPTPTPTNTPNEPTPTPRPNYCSTPNAPIPDYSDPPVPLIDSITITDHNTITDLDVSVLIHHTWVGDIRMILKHVDTGTTVTIIDRPGEPAMTNGCREDDIDAVLDDAAPDPVEDECSSVNPAAIYGRFYPNNPLSAFNDEDIYGVWQAIITDNYYGDSGSLISWCLLPAFDTIVTPTPSPTYAETVTPTSTGTLPPTPTPSPTFTGTVTPTSTGTLPPTPTCSQTQTPQPTDTPTPTPTYSGTATPPPPTTTPTPTPSGSPTPLPDTPTPPDTFTPTPRVSPTPECPETGVEISMPAEMFHPGDTCWCRAAVCNAEGDTLSGYPLFVVLDVFGNYYFGPDFTELPDNYLDAYPEWPTGETIVEVLPEFFWPENAGTAEGIIWYAALTDPDVRNIFGTLGTFRFGWTE